MSKLYYAIKIQNVVLKLFKMKESCKQIENRSILSGKKKIRYRHLYKNQSSLTGISINKSSSHQNCTYTLLTRSYKILKLWRRLIQFELTIGSLSFRQPIRDIGTKNYWNSSTSEVAKMTRNLGNFCKHKADGVFLMQMSKIFLIERGIRVSEKWIIELSQRLAFKQKLERKCNLADESTRQLVNGTVYLYPDSSDILWGYIVSLFDFLESL